MKKDEPTDLMSFISDTCVYSIGKAELEFGSNEINDSHEISGCAVSPGSSLGSLDQAV